MNEATTKLLKDLEGWESLEINSEQAEAIRNEQEKEGRQIASMFHQAFRQNEAGAKCLDIMIKQTILKPVVTPAATQFEAGIREGRADMVRQIMLNIELAEGS